MAIEQQTTSDVPEIPPIELPDEVVRRVLGIYEPVLAMAVEELFTRGYPGWGTFLATHYALINDVLGVKE